MTDQELLAYQREHHDDPDIAATSTSIPYGHDGSLVVSMRGPTTPGASMTYTDADSTGATVDTAGICLRRPAFGGIVEAPEVIGVAIQPSNADARRRV